jgi:hypothetical protein
MDFYRIRERVGKGGDIDVVPDFKVVRSKDLMVRSRAFYAIWDEERGLWSTDEYDVQRLVDEDLERHSKGVPGSYPKFLSDFSSNSWMMFRKYVGHLSDSSHQLDENLTFSNTKVKKDDYVSRRLPYPLGPGDISAYDELIGTLYEPSERAKLEWAIGAVIAGDAKNIQKFIVLYGKGGTGKSTLLNLVQKLFDGYYTTFEAKALTSSSNAFSTEAFRDNPLVAIQHDGDLSKIEDNTKLNSIISHEDMTMNEKYKPSYMAKINAFLFMGTNKPVKITDAKSGIIRRLIDVHPSGEKVTPRRYQTLVSQMDFELGAIAHHCLERYREMGKDYYSGYKPVEMMLQTDVFFNFIESYYDVFQQQNGASLKQAYELYKQYCEDAAVEYKLARHRFRDEFRNYFDNFEERAEIDGVLMRSWYSGFKADHFKSPVGETEDRVFSLVMDEHESLLDKELADYPAQYSKDDGFPQLYWDDTLRTDKDGKEFTPRPQQIVSTILSDLDTTKEHYVKVPPNHIVLDFDLKDANGEKSAERNLAAASQFPATYAEYSKGGAGIHLHYIYEGDPTELAREYDDGIEIKAFTGNSSLRRRLSLCNAVPVATINSGLPLREKKVINAEGVKSELALRDLIMRNLRKEIHPGTKPSMDFIHKILEDAYKSELPYDVTDMRGKILAFANNSSNHALYCIKLVQSMQFKSEDAIEAAPALPKDERIVIFDCEVFPNLFVVCWKYQGPGHEIVRMINPTPQEIEQLLAMKLVGYNCRKYDNHILYARFQGYNNEQLYKLSKKIIESKKGGNPYFGAAYDLSYADMYDYASKKQSLKKWEIELGLKHQEWPGGWDDPIADDEIMDVVEYCANDVEATDVVFDHIKQDFVARLILADLSGMPVNATTQQHTAKIVFNGDRQPQKEFVYTDLSEMFPGYKYSYGKSTYREIETGEGGWVYAVPGMYNNVAVLDVASMHPTSIEQLDMFGPYTRNYSALKAARLAIKRGDYDGAKKMFGGKLARHLVNDDAAEALSYALKIVINIVYGLTSAKFDNAFKDPRNIDNIVAKRGALFMVDLKYFVEEQGYKVIHIKTDSIKIPDADQHIIDLVMEFGTNYGYTFEHEATYEKMALVNDAVYAAKTKPGRKPAYWETVGAQFQHPYVKKTLFTHEPIEFKDLCETKTVTTALYLDFGKKKPKFVGRAGSFVPVMKGFGGGQLVRSKDIVNEETGETETKFYAATGTKGHDWLEAEMVKQLDKQDDIDMSYFENLTAEAMKTLSKFGDAQSFIS